MLSDKYLLNVNFIKKSLKKTKGILITDIGHRPMEYYYVKDGNHYTSRRKFMEHDPEEGSDLWAIRNGYISITPLKFGNQTDYGLRELRNKVSRSE